MSNPEEEHSKEVEHQQPAQAPTSMEPPPPMAGRDVESQTRGVGFGVSAIVRRWRREDLLKRGSLAMRGLGFLFSILAFIIMASNKHGDWKNFDRYDEYRYLLAIAILSTLYTGAQAFRQVRELSTGKQLVQPRTMAFIDFYGDQILAYCLISSASTAVPLTNYMRENVNNVFTDASAAAISMQFLAFFAIAVSAIISGYKLFNQPYT